MNALPFESLNKLSAEHWKRLTQRTIYFGHQSVGDNILDGIRMLAEENGQTGLRIISGPPATPSPAIVEFKIGKNRHPESKNANFLSTMEITPLGPDPVLMFKYCYIDMRSSTDVDELFRGYRETVEILHHRYPHAQVVHVTMPLMVLPPGQDKVEAHENRSRYNDLMRSFCAGREPIFDLAMVESTRADGTQESTLHQGKLIYSMAPEWSSDEGHLNPAGGKRAAEKMLLTLASLPNA